MPGEFEGVQPHGWGVAGVDRHFHSQGSHGAVLRYAHRRLGELSQPGGSLYAIEHSNGGLITFPGGVPIRNRSGAVIGAIGVSGSEVANDHAVAEAGAAAG